MALAAFISCISVSFLGHLGTFHHHFMAFVLEIYSSI